MLPFEKQVVSLELEKKLKEVYYVQYERKTIYCGS